MSATWKSQLLGLLTVTVIGLNQHAQAQTTPLAVDSALNYDGLLFTVASCSYVVQTVAQAGCGPAGAELLASNSVGGPAVEILGSAAGAPILSLASASGDTYSDLSLVLNISAASTNTTISSVTDTLSGATSSTALSAVSSARASTASRSLPLTTSLQTPTATASFATFSPAASPMTLSIDLNVSSTIGVGADVGGLSLNNVTYTFSKAPEPASIALFGIALVGLAVARKQAKRPAR